ncbi:hypothetical protein HDU86_002339 [Geranomyces michiganensis]|nr:hypothetical protein HDU86_002339 [Geranomyces michiganensis]
MVLCAGAISWVDKVIPWFSPLRTTGFIQWKWLEIGYGARMLDIEANNNYAPRIIKLGGGVGITTADGLGDLFKLIENSILSLRHIMAMHRNATWSTMKGMCTLTVQLIKDRLKLLRTSIAQADSVYKWEVVELRNAELPASWERMSNVMRRSS